MSRDDGFSLNLKNFKLSYYMGDGAIESWKCKSLEEAIEKVQEVEKEYGQSEYGVSFVNRLKKK